MLLPLFQRQGWAPYTDTNFLVGSKNPIPELCHPSVLPSTVNFLRRVLNAN